MLAPSGPGKPRGSQWDGEEEQTIVVEEVKGLRLWLILFTCWIGVFLGAIDSTVIATLSAPISSDFQSMSLLSWLATAYLISNAGMYRVGRDYNFFFHFFIAWDNVVINTK